MVFRRLGLTTISLVVLATPVGAEAAVSTEDQNCAGVLERFLSLLADSSEAAAIRGGVAADGNGACDALAVVLETVLDEYLEDPGLLPAAAESAVDASGGGTETLEDLVADRDPERLLPDTSGSMNAPGTMGDAAGAPDSQPGSDTASASTSITSDAAGNRVSTIAVRINPLWLMQSFESDDETSVTRLARQARTVDATLLLPVGESGRYDGEADYLGWRVRFSPTGLRGANALAGNVRSAWVERSDAIANLDAAVRRRG